MLEIDPDADPAEVAAVYRAVRPWALTADPAAAARGRSGRRVRPQGERALALAAFTATTPGTWQQVQRQWNAKSPQWASQAPISSFAARATDVVRRLLWPGWFPGLFGSDPPEAWGPADISGLRKELGEGPAREHGAPGPPGDGSRQGPSGAP